jgi:HPt (histidine-containing phosphotransfer) domain-containing protein
MPQNPSSDPAILNFDHLERQVAGDASLKREILQLFQQQTMRITALLQTSTHAHEKRDAAHTLKGAARAIGAEIIADHASRLEILFDRHQDADADLAALKQAIAAADALINAHLAP